MFLTLSVLISKIFDLYLDSQYDCGFCYYSMLSRLVFSNASPDLCIENVISKTLDIEVHWGVFIYLHAIKFDNTTIIVSTI